MDPRKIGTNCGPMVLSLTLFQENYVSWLIVNHGECWCWTDKSIKWEAFKVLWDWKDFASYLEAYSEHSTTPKMEFFTRIVDSWKLFAIFTNCFVLNVRLGYEYPTVTHPPVHYQTFINYFAVRKAELTFYSPFCIISTNVLKLPMIEILAKPFAIFAKVFYHRVFIIVPRGT